MYCIMMDSKTKCFYMAPGEIAFVAFSSPEKYDPRVVKSPTARLVETDYDDPKEFTTALYNAGFSYGTVDGEEARLTRASSYYYDVNSNEVLFAQYALTGNTDVLKLLSKRKLVTVCKIEGNQVYFPTVTLPTGESAVLTYTDRVRIPQKIFDKYSSWRVVRMTFDARCVVNSQVIVE